MILEHKNDCVVVGEDGSADEAIARMAANSPDLATIDISIDGAADGLDLVKVIRERFPIIRCLVLSIHEEPQFAERAIRAGAGGYLSKREAATEIVRAIQTIMRGDLYLNDQLSKTLLKKLLGNGNGLLAVDNPSEILSIKELSVYELIGRGFSTGDIARKKGISVHTVESYRRKLKDKLNLESASELTRSAIQWAIKKNNKTT